MKLYCGFVVLCLVGYFACTTLHVLVLLQLPGLSVDCTTAAPQKRSAEDPEDLVCGATVFPVDGRLWTKSALVLRTLTFPLSTTIQLLARKWRY